MPTIYVLKLRTPHTIILQNVTHTPSSVKQHIPACCFCLLFHCGPNIGLMHFDLNLQKNTVWGELYRWRCVSHKQNSHKWKGTPHSLKFQDRSLTIRLFSVIPSKLVFLKGGYSTTEMQVREIIYKLCSIIYIYILLYNFSKFLYIFTLFIHPSTLNITNNTPQSWWWFSGTETL